MVLGITEGAQDISFKEMTRIQRQPERHRRAGSRTCRPMPPRSAPASAARPTNNGRMFIALKPWDERVGGTAQDFINRLRPKLQKVRAARCSCRPAQDIRVGGRLTKTEFQYTLQDADLAELYQWAPKILDKLQSLPMLRDVATDQQIAGTTATLTIDRDQAARFGIQPQVIDDTLYDAFGQRQITQYFSQVNSYHLILEVMPDQAGDVDDAEQALREVAAPARRCRCPPS